jgi:hypothetical protein
MSSQLENDIDKIKDGLSGLTDGLSKYLMDVKDKLETPEEKAKFAEALQASNVMTELKKVTEQFKDVLK